MNEGPRDPRTMADPRRPSACSPFGEGPATRSRPAAAVWACAPHGAPAGAGTRAKRWECAAAPPLGAGPGLRRSTRGWPGVLDQHAWTASAIRGPGGGGGGAARACTDGPRHCHRTPQGLSWNICAAAPPPPPSGCTWSTARATAPSPGQPTPGVVKQDKSSGGSVDTTYTRSGPQRVGMCSGEGPIGAAKGKISDTEALCQPPPPPTHTNRAQLTWPPKTNPGRGGGGEDRGGGGGGQGIGRGGGHSLGVRVSPASPAPCRSTGSAQAIAFSRFGYVFGDVWGPPR